MKNQIFSFILFLYAFSALSAGAAMDLSSDIDSTLALNLTSQESPLPAELPESEDDGENEEPFEDISVEEGLLCAELPEFHAHSTKLIFSYHSPESASFTDRLFRPPKV